jgi:hypothetical protein
MTPWSETAAKYENAAKRPFAPFYPALPLFYLFFSPQYRETGPYLSLELKMTAQPRHHPGSDPDGRLIDIKGGRVHAGDDALCRIHHS